MNFALKYAIQNPCPNCKALAGQVCDYNFTKKQYGLNYTCLERQRITPPPPIKNIGVLFERSKAKNKKGISNKCRSNRHDICSGILYLNHGLKGKCKCSCHAVVPSPKKID